MLLLYPIGRKYLNGRDSMLKTRGSSKITSQEVAQLLFMIIVNGSP